MHWENAKSLWLVATSFTMWHYFQIIAHYFNISKINPIAFIKKKPHNNLMDLSYNCNYWKTTKTKYSITWLNGSCTNMRVARYGRRLETQALFCVRTYVQLNSVIFSIMVAQSNFATQFTTLPELMTNSKRN